PQLAALGVNRPLLVLDRGPVAMAGHGALLQRTGIRSQGSGSATVPTHGNCLWTSRRCPLVTGVNSSNPLAIVRRVGIWWKWSSWSCRLCAGPSMSAQALFLWRLDNDDSRGLGLQHLAVADNGVQRAIDLETGLELQSSPHLLRVRLRLHPQLAFRHELD